MSHDFSAYRENGNVGIDSLSYSVEENHPAVMEDRSFFGAPMDERVLRNGWPSNPQAVHAFTMFSYAGSASLPPPEPLWGEDVPPTLTVDEVPSQLASTTVSGEQRAGYQLSNLARPAQTEQLAYEGTERVHLLGDNGYNRQLDAAFAGMQLGTAPPPFHASSPHPLANTWLGHPQQHGLDTGSYSQPVAPTPNAPTEHHPPLPPAAHPLADPISHSSWADSRRVVAQEPPAVAMPHQQRQGGLWEEHVFHQDPLPLCPSAPMPLQPPLPPNPRPQGLPEGPFGSHGEPLPSTVPTDFWNDSTAQVSMNPPPLPPYPRPQSQPQRPEATFAPQMPAMRNVEPAAAAAGFPLRFRGHLRRRNRQPCSPSPATIP
ncbi:hypothetical protein CYMTET_4478 [Cymbomonas tetramitiformis]|uniref:Uncharacterized protein n=1 Tax=Cymbomonas tetramitiformis TaxID=36881 RepID=A0AAE0H128_9CHLO|nr:hypothetical protein CYMTET_4478 [Cymbomonas tetramitiformis]